MGTLTGLQKFREMAVAAAVQTISKSLLAMLLPAVRQRVQGVMAAWITGDFRGLLPYAVLTRRSFAEIRASDDIHRWALSRYAGPLYVSNLVAYLAN